MAEELKLKGNACYAKGEWADAVQWYTRAIEIDPAVSSYYSNRAICQIKLGRYREAYDNTEEGLRRNPDEKLALKLYARKADCQKSLGDIAGARVSLEKALRLVPDSAPVKRQLMELPPVGKSGSESTRISVRVVDSLPEVYGGAAPAEVAAAFTAKETPSRAIPFTPSSLPLTVYSLVQLMRCPKTDLPLVYSFLFYNVPPKQYTAMHQDGGIEYEVVEFLLDAMAAELAGDKSPFAVARAVDLLNCLAQSKRFAVVRAFVSKQRVLAVLEALGGLVPQNIIDGIKMSWV